MFTVEEFARACGLSRTALLSYESKARIDRRARATRFDRIVRLAKRAPVLRNVVIAVQPGISPGYGAKEADALRLAYLDQAAHHLGENRIAGGRVRKSVASSLGTVRRHQCPTGSRAGLAGGPKWKRDLALPGTQQPAPLSFEGHPAYRLSMGFR